MVVVYEEMEKLHHTIAPIVVIKTHSKERVAMLKEAMTNLDRIHEWSEKYPKAPVVVPRKDWIAMKNTRVLLHIKVQSRKKWPRMRRGCWSPTNTCSIVWNQ